MAGCRDCKSCTATVGAKLMMKALSLGTFFWLIRPLVMRTCPQCKHKLGRHQRRADGSFRD